MASKSTPRKKKTITAKQASQSAAAYLGEMVAGVSNVRVEEVERADTTGMWLITLSYNAPSPMFIPLGGTTGYKIFEVDDQTGEVRSMKIRQV